MNIQVLAKDAFNQGKKARVSGHSRHDNPFRNTNGFNEAYRQWDQGWQSGVIEQGVKTK